MGEEAREREKRVWERKRDGNERGERERERVWERKRDGNKRGERERESESVCTGCPSPSGASGQGRQQAASLGQHQDVYGGPLFRK